MAHRGHQAAPCEPVILVKELNQEARLFTVDPYRGSFH